MCQVEGCFGTICNFRVVAYKIYGKREDEAGAELAKAIDRCCKDPVPKSAEEEIREIGERICEIEARFDVEIRSV